jgi:hypothetical protein
MDELDYLGFTQIAYTNFLDGEDGHNDDQFRELMRRGESITVGQLLDISADNHGADNLISPSIRDWTIDAVFDTDDDRNGRDGGGVVAYIASDDEGNAMIAFRGTSQDFEWVQDFELMNSTQTNHQKDIEAFLADPVNKKLLSQYKSISITGHSLGGNDADYAAIILAQDGYADKIDSVYNMDGPGHSQEFLNAHAPDIEKLQGKLHHRRWSLVGMLLNDMPGCDSIIVETNPFSRDGEPSNLLFKHDTGFVATDKNRNMIPGEPDILMLRAAELSVMLDDLPDGLGDAVAASLASLVTTIFESKEIMFDENGNLTPEGTAVVTGVIMAFTIDPRLRSTLPSILGLVALLVAFVHYEFVLDTTSVMIEVIKMVLAAIAIQRISSALAWAKQTITNIISFLKRSTEVIVQTAKACVAVIGDAISRSVAWINNKIRQSYVMWVAIARKTQEVFLDVSEKVTNRLIELAWQSWEWGQATTDDLILRARNFIDISAFVSRNFLIPLMSVPKLPSGAFYRNTSSSLSALLRKRDFSLAKKQELLSRAHNISEPAFWQVPERLWRRAEYLAAAAQVFCDFSEAKTYGRSVRDSNETNIQRVEQVFAQAYEADAQHSAKIKEITDTIRQITQTLCATANTIKV